MTSAYQPNIPHANRDILLGAAAGIAIGLGVAQLPEGSTAHGSATWLIGLLGGMFVAALKMLMAPLLFASVAGGIRALWAQRDAGRIWQTTLLFFAFTAAVAVTLGIVAANLFQPGIGLPHDLLPVAAAAREAPDAAGFLQKLLVDSLQNPFRALTEAAVLPLIVAALLLGAAVGQQPQRFATLGRLIDELLDLALLVVGWVMRLAPIGIGALLAKLAATATAAVFGALAKFAAVVLGTTLLHGVVTLPLLVWLLAGVPPWRYFAGIRLPMLTALATSSSAATMPVTLRSADHDLRIDPAVSRFVIPLGTTVNMDGTALYEAAAALFVAQLAGIELSLAQQVIVALMAMLAAIGAPGIPSAGMVTMVMVLQSVGLPVEAIALLLPIDRLLDAVRTMVNVQGDLATSLVVERLVGRSRQRPAA
ncbi:MAG: dicarboxylate/amino acid:cation symporter [Betaproteobacteria bacterium]|nr:dicarboxylate/amino acid:cation symporter [Betaproteobacteria bacterium]